MFHSLNTQLPLMRNLRVVGQSAVRFLKALDNKVIAGVEARRPSSQATYGSALSGFGWCATIKQTLRMMIAALILLSAANTYAAVFTAGGATIHNAVTLQFNGRTSQVFVDVKVKTIGVAPNIAVNTPTQTTTPGSAVTYTYTIINKTNGVDTFTFNAATVDAGGITAPAINVAGTGLVVTSLTLGASITNAVNTVANTFVIPAGSEVGFAAGDTVVINNNLYLIAVGGISAGTPQTLGAAEIPSVITVTPIGASPALAIGAVAAGLQIGEQQIFDVVLTAGAPSGSHTVNLTGSTLANAVTTNAPVAYTTDTVSGNETTTVVAGAQITFVKEVRSVSAAGVFTTQPLEAQSTNILEYRTTLTEPTNVVAQTSGTLTDEVPALTTYVAGSTTLNGVAVPDGPGGTLPLSAANGGILVNDAGSVAGVIAAGKSAVVIFRVTVN